MVEGEGIMREVSVSVLIPCRDGASTIEATIKSLLNQTIETFIAVTDDASVDETPKILERLSKTKRVRYVRYPRREPKNYVRVPVLLNMLLDILPPADFYMLSGDDSVYPPDYLSELIALMRANGVDMASGCHNIKSYKHLTMPSGSGRLVTAGLFEKLTPFPNSIGWESWMIYKAMSFGKKVAVYPVEFEHGRGYSFGSVRTFGYSAYVNGVPLIFTIFRAAKAILTGLHSPINALSIPLGQIEYAIRRVDKLDCASFVYDMHKRRIRQTIVGVLS
jgi:glycosyltransferase involved in cell wall biosynthesis